MDVVGCSLGGLAEQSMGIDLLFLLFTRKLPEGIEKQWGVGVNVICVQVFCLDRDKLHFRGRTVFSSLASMLFCF
jgi:hypothetical protein